MLVLMVSSTAHSLEMSTGQGICSLARSTQFPVELRSATNPSGMEKVQLERERRVL